MQRRQLMGIVVIVAVVVIGSWCSARLLYGRPHWASLAAVGSAPGKDASHREGTPGTPAPSAASKSAAGACCPAGGDAAGGSAPAGAKTPADSTAKCPYASGATSPSALPTGHPPLSETSGSDAHGSPRAGEHARAAQSYAMGGDAGTCPAAGGQAQDAASAKDAHASSAPALAKDPVCGMMISPAHATLLKHGGKEYRFCSPTCRDTFKKDPARYL